MSVYIFPKQCLHSGVLTLSSPSPHHGQLGRAVTSKRGSEKHARLLGPTTLSSPSRHHGQLCRAVPLVDVRRRRSACGNHCIRPTSPITAYALHVDIADYVLHAELTANTFGALTILGALTMSRMRKSLHTPCMRQSLHTPYMWTSLHTSYMRNSRHTLLGRLPSWGRLHCPRRICTRPQTISKTAHEALLTAQECLKTAQVEPKMSPMCFPRLPKGLQETSQNAPETQPRLQDSPKPPRPRFQNP